MFGLLCCAALASAAEQRTPNVLFILADDLGYGDLPAYGNPYVETPAIDSLAGTGVRLTDHYAPSPLCAPSRAGFLTGRYNHRTGAVDVSSNRGIDRIAPSEKTFGDYFRHAGYATALIGKWHNGLYNADQLPHRRGFDLFYGFPNGAQDYWDWNLMRNGADESSDGRYLPDALNDETIRFIKEHRDEPFAVFLAHNAVHDPFQAPPELVEKYAAKVGAKYGTTVATIYAMIEAMDSGLGRVFETLNKLELWEDTIIVFTSDNGAILTPRGELNLSTQRFHAGLSGNKGNVSEQGIRVPAIASWPGRIPGGGTVSTPVHGCDWLPTLFALTGAEPPPGAKPFDGRDVMKVLSGKQDLSERVLPFQKNRYTPVAHSDAAIRKGRWKLYWPPAPVTMQKDNARDAPSYRRGVVEKHWEMPLDPDLPDFAGVETEQPKLFDLSQDPSESLDLSAKHPEIVQELQERYDAWFRQVFADWKHSNREIVEADRRYWRTRDAPDPRMLFDRFWQWGLVDGSPESNDPLDVFKGYWSY